MNSTRKPFNKTIDDPNEILSVIHSLEQNNKIFLSGRNVKNIADVILDVKKINQGNNSYSFYMMLYNHASHWTSAKITVNSNIIVEFADSKIFGPCPAELEIALKTQFPHKKFILKYQDNVLTQPHASDSAYLAIYNILRDLDGLSKIGGWSNESKNIPALRSSIQQAAHIDSKLQPKKLEFPFHLFINDSVNKLNSYVTDQRNSISFKNGWKKEGYEKRLDEATEFAEKIQNATCNKDLNSIRDEISRYRINLQKANPHSGLVVILKSIEDHITSRFEVIKDKSLEFLFHEAMSTLESCNTDAEITPNEYSWLGNQLIMKKSKLYTHGITPKHTIVDQYIGKLYLLMNTPDMDKNIKYTDMQLLINQAYKDIRATHYQDRENDASETTTYPSNYARIWNHRNSNNHVTSALNLLQDYIKSGDLELFFTGHWRRQHISLVRNALAAFNKKDDLKVDDILDFFSKQLEWQTTNPCGSLIKRLHFIANQSGKSFSLDLDRNLRVEENGKEVIQRTKTY